ncbi:hypothetical protein B6D17_11020, partial [Gilliamella apis]|uniref:hypothetical protein n=1 Tax=Gilliamella apis TaxID=1970738 RepID=UPI000B6AE0BF
NAVVKYGFVLKQWFIVSAHSDSWAPIPFVKASSWCNKTGYRMPKVRDLTNASCLSDSSGACENYANGLNALTATPSSPDNFARRHIGAGFITEWGDMNTYTGANFIRDGYQSSELTSDGRYVFTAYVSSGYVSAITKINIYPDVRLGIGFLCTYP